MQVLIMRHGDAVPDAASDAVRPLSARGVEESRQMAFWLQAQNRTIERVLVSPYIRAQQTLATLRGVLPLPAEEDCLPELTPGGDADHVRDYLHALAQTGVKSVLVVSHLPLVGYLVASLCPPLCAPMFATSAIACVTLTGDIGHFEGQTTPAQLALKS